MRKSPTEELFLLLLRMIDGCRSHSSEGDVIPQLGGEGAEEAGAGLAVCPVP